MSNVIEHNEEDKSVTNQLLAIVQHLGAVYQFYDNYNTEITEKLAKIETEFITRGENSPILRICLEHLLNFQKNKANFLEIYPKLLLHRDQRLVALCKVVGAYNKGITEAKTKIMQGNLPQISEIYRHFLLDCEINRSILLKDYQKELLDL